MFLADNNTIIIIYVYYSLIWNLLLKTRESTLMEIVDFSLIYVTRFFEDFLAILWWFYL